MAVRIARACRRLGIESVAVHSWDDRDALHVRSADRAVAVGPSPAAASYLDAGRIIAAARSAGAEAVHPGYGFLSENAAFARAVREAGLGWIGPPPEAVALMADKARARARMEEAGVPVVPGLRAEGAPEEIARACRPLGYPLLVKAAAGGGGRGMRRADSEGELAPALAAAAREAEAAFGDGTLLVERLVEGARHVEVQVLADSHGGLVHLFERDCSVQRRHQKVIEEAPAPGLGPDLRAAMAEAACRAAAAVGYEGAGTVEFLLAPDSAFHFIEMNTRLQVEHPVTELVTGIDIVEWQFRVAAGEPLGFAQEDVRIGGHAIEARVCAEEPERDFRPSPGRILHARWPEGVRVDEGFATGDRVSAHYDSLLAKVVVHAGAREEARTGLRDALRATEIAGPATNLRFLVRCLDDPAFVAGGAATDFVAARAETLSAPAPEPDDRALALAGLGTALAEARPAARDPWGAGDGWRPVGPPARTFVFARADGSVPVTARPGPDGAWEAAVGDAGPAAAGRIGADGALEAAIDGKPARARVVPGEGVVHLFADGGWWRIPRLDRPAATASGAGAGGAPAAMMPGRVVSVEVEAGERVARGATLAVVEAMKIEQKVEAPADGVVTEVLVAEGAWVAEGEPVVAFEPAAA